MKGNEEAAEGFVGENGSRVGSAGRNVSGCGGEGDLVRVSW